jgi:hypothetical protein
VISSPLGVKFTPGVEVKNGLLFTRKMICLWYNTMPTKLGSIPNVSRAVV